jgi:hypothetical protein
MVLLPLSACAAHFEVDCDVLEYRRLSCLLILRKGGQALEMCIYVR